MDKLIIWTTPSDFVEGFRIILEEHNSVNIQPTFETDKMNPTQASIFSGVSYLTMCKWIKSGKVKAYGKGRTRFLLRSELIDSLKNMK